jgi:hypothetical protein
MALETAQYINNLNASNPLSTDSVAQADDHIRLIKSAVKATFPNITGPVTATQGQLNSPIPAGIIAMWSGALLAVPSGWALCDGSNGTPDLRNRFVVSQGSTYPLGTTGGGTTTSSGGSHSHTTSTTGSHSHSGVTGGTALTVDQIPSHTHTYQTDGTDGSRLLAAGGSFSVDGNTATTSSTGGSQTHTHTISSDGAHSHTVSTASDHTHTVTPPYFALAYIMKV